MALTKTPIELSSTPSIVDGGNATAITIDSNEDVTLAGTLNVTGDGDDIIVNSSDYELVLIGNRGSSGANLDKAYLRMKSEGTNTIVLDTEGPSFFKGGNIGLGTDSPDNKLHIYAGDSGHSWSYDSGDFFIIENSDSVAMNMVSPSSNQNLILFSDNAARGIGLIGYNHSEDTLRFHANGEQRLKLNGASSGEAVMKITQSSETGGQLLIRSNYSDPHYLATQGTNHSSGGWYWGYGVEMSGSGTTKSTFSNFNGPRSIVQLLGGEIKYSFAGSQNTTIGDAVSLTESVRIDPQGIKFNGDTATGNALDDYEEGSWTPVLDGLNAGDYTMGGSNAGRYTKVGDVVVATATVQWTARTTAYSGHLLISGYPFACGTVRAAGTLAAVNSGLTFSSSTYDNYWSINIDPGNTYAYIIENGDGTYGHNPTVGTSGLIYTVTLVYKTS